MSYYVKAQKNKYNIDYVFSYSANELAEYDYTFENEPRLGQYIVGGNLIRDDQYDSVIAPIIRNAVSDTAGVIAPIILQEAPAEIIPEPVPDGVTEPWKTEPVSEELLDDWTEKAESLSKLITYASNPANINQENKLVMRVFIRSGEPRDPPAIINILDPATNVTSVSDYIQLLTRRRDEINTKIIPWIQGELSKNT